MSSARCGTCATLRYISWECKTGTILEDILAFLIKKKKHMCNVHQEFHYLVLPQEKRSVCLFTNTGAELFSIYMEYSKLETCLGLFSQWGAVQRLRKPSTPQLLNHARHEWASAVMSTEGGSQAMFLPDTLQHNTVNFRPMPTNRKQREKQRAGRPPRRARGTPGAGHGHQLGCRGGGVGAWLLQYLNLILWICSTYCTPTISK